MKANTSRGIIADTGFWIALFDRGDAGHSRAIEVYRSIQNGVLLMPWPIYYEVLRTRFVRQPTWVDQFSKFLVSSRTIQIDDQSYRGDALNQTFAACREGRSISLVDMVIRLVLRDEKFRIVRLLTFNPKDFHDICRDRNIPIH